MKQYSFKINGLPHQLFAPLATMPYSLFFDSADQKHELSRYSFLAFHPLEVIESKNGLITVTNQEQNLSFYSNPFQVVRDRLELYGLEKESHPDLPPFQGGAAGLFSYDLVRNLEKIPQKSEDCPSIPDMAVGIYDQVFAYDHQKNQGWFITHAKDELIAKAKYNHFLRLTQQVQKKTKIGNEESQWHDSHTRAEYETAIQKVIDYIYAGDIFQANLSHRLEAPLPPSFDPWMHYLTMRSVNAAPFATYMNFGKVKLASASPERFLFVKNRQVETRPIKGTQKHIDDPAIDKLYRNKLESSTKDRAENTMIVDLLRNDLSKVCEDHSIQVPELCRLETFAKVHHLTSIVTGTLRADQTPIDLLEACFPGGSITGAPKIRAMEIIEELEHKRRGPYCGSMGYISFDGTMDTNIVIRTLVYNEDENKVSFNVGGGIVADSKPADEYEETLTKAEAIFNSFEIKNIIDVKEKKKLA